MMKQGMPELALLDLYNRGVMSVAVDENTSFPPPGSHGHPRKVFDPSPGDTGAPTLVQQINEQEHELTGRLSAVKTKLETATVENSSLKATLAKLEHTSRGNARKMRASLSKTGLAQKARALPIRPKSTDEVHNSNNESDELDSCINEEEIDEGIPERTTFDWAWNHHFRRLQRFKKRYGHFRVPRTYNTVLNDWVSRQRRVLNGKKRGVMNEDRLAALARVGFNDKEAVCAEEQHDEPLKETTQQEKPLKKVQAGPGNQDESAKKVRKRLDKPTKHVQDNLDNPTRAVHTIPVQDDPVQDNLEPVGGDGKENEHAIVFANGDPYSRGVPGSDHLGRQWNIKYLELRKFYATYGHCRVPPTHDKALSSWVIYQRQLYHGRKKGNRGEMINMEPQRVAALDAIGMDWGDHGDGAKRFRRIGNEIVDTRKPKRHRRVSRDLKCDDTDTSSGGGDENNRSKTAGTKLVSQIGGGRGMERHVSQIGAFQGVNGSSQSNCLPGPSPLHLFLSDL